MKQGHWVILDELNMASSEILEALNRLLDDNRELLVPDTQEIVRPALAFSYLQLKIHPDHMRGERCCLKPFRIALS